ncbi:MAG: phosphoglycolate phosphatase [Methanomassiliicoccales archaeon]
MIRAIVVDIDGTITDPRRRLEVSAMESLRRVQDNGVITMVASGNVLPVSYGLSTFVGMNGPIIAENGGLVSYEERIYTVHSNHAATEAYEYLRTIMPVERLFTDRWRETQVALKLTVDPDEVREALRGREVVVETTGFAIHLMEPGHSKFSGVRKACELLGIGVEEVAAFGDSDNDAKMIQGCGRGIAVGNASPAAKEVADHVTSRPNGEGVTEGMEWLGLL